MYRSARAYTNSREKRKSARYALYTCKPTQGKKERGQGTGITRGSGDSIVAVGRCNAATGRHLPVSLPTSTLDSIQCHSISQCNAHAAAYRCTAFRNETTAVSTGTSLLSVPPCNRSAGPRSAQLSPPSIKASRGYSACHIRAFYTDFIFQLHFVVY